MMDSAIRSKIRRLPAAVAPRTGDGTHETLANQLPHLFKKAL